LIVGGGDGGVLREVVKHPCLKQVTLCEIDKDVVEISKQLLPKMAVAFNHPKANVVIGDGLQYLKENKNKFDIIITDSSDPIGPAGVLFEKPYFELLKDSLREGGIICSQAENMFLHLETIKKIVEYCKQIFPSVEYAFTVIPTYPGGQIGFLLCGPKSCKSALRKPDFEELQYYSPEIHTASFVLPAFVKKALDFQ